MGKKTREKMRMQCNILLTAQEHSCQSEGKRGGRNTIVIYFASMLAKHDDDDDSR